MFSHNLDVRLPFIFQPTILGGEGGGGALPLLVGNMGTVGGVHYFNSPLDVNWNGRGFKTHNFTQQVFACQDYQHMTLQSLACMNSLLARAASRGC